MGGDEQPEGLQPHGVQNGAAYRPRKLTTVLQVADASAKVIGSILVPLAIFYWAQATNRTQTVLMQEQTALRYIDIFYREITSTEPQRRRYACDLLRELKPSVQVPLLLACSVAEPTEALELATDIAEDRGVDRSTRSAAQRARLALLEQFTITEPKDRDPVGLFARVKGTTPFHDLHHYPVVGLKDTFFPPQEELAISHGAFTGRVKLGEAGAGQGETYRIYVLATDVTLEQLQEMWPKKPQTAIESNSVSVQRTR